jgi:hypothetical protein
MPMSGCCQGVLGIALSGVAYLPQVVHLGRQRCSAGISRPAWALWVASSLLIGAQALSSRNLVFCALQGMNLIASIAIFGLAYRYREMVCDLHRREMGAPNPPWS